MKNRSLTLIFILLCFYSVQLKAQFPPTDSAYQLVFHDEFDSVYPTVVDTSKWGRTPPWGTKLIIKLFDLEGQIILENNFKNISSLISVDLPELSDGTYFLNLRNENYNVTQKIFIQK